MGILRFFEPEETVGNLWHDLASRIGEDGTDDGNGVALAEVRGSLALLFRALGGSHDVEIMEAAVMRADHKRKIRRRITHGYETVIRPSFDGERLRLPPMISCFETRELNKAAYLWLTASAALAEHDPDDLAKGEVSPEERDQAYVRLSRSVSQLVYQACPGLRSAYQTMCRETLAQRRQSESLLRSHAEREVRQWLSILPDQKQGAAPTEPLRQSARRGANRIPPIPFWLDFLPTVEGNQSAEDAEAGETPPPSAGTKRLKLGNRRDLDQANRKDSFIIHRFETILSWVESMDINRTVEDDDDENARKAADDQDSVTLSKHDKKTASRLHLHLDLSPAEAEHERIAARYTYPEWNHRRQAYMADHCRVLETDADTPESTGFHMDPRNAARVRRQFEVLRSRRIFQTRQTDGDELDFDALITAHADLVATGWGSDRIYISSRRIERDLSVALLLDTSRSTEADMNGSCVLDVARNAVSALAHGLDACGDRFGIWSFSSLRRNRIFVTCCKDFETPMSSLIDRRIAGLRSGHYTRLGAAIRHVSARLAKQDSAQKLLLILTDGKPNDLDHYEGRHGIEDSRMAVREARRQAQVVHGVVIDEDGQDWFARIFERGGFTLLQHPDRLVTALPEIYRSLTQEF